MYNRLVAISLTFLLCTFISSANADQGERIAQLKTTNNELVLRLAEVLEENTKLKTAIKQAISASNKSIKIVSGCDPLEFHKSVVFANGALNQENISIAWIKRNGPTCSIPQLKQIILTAKSNVTYRTDSIKLLNYFIQTN